jgi:hypothetical protein
MSTFEQALSALREGKIAVLKGDNKYYFFNALGDLMISCPLGARETGKPLRGDYPASGFTASRVLSNDWIILDQFPWQKNTATPGTPYEALPLQGD